GLVEGGLLGGGGEGFGGDLLGREQRERRDLAPDLAEPRRGRLVDLALRLLEPPLAVLLDLAPQPLALGVGDLPRLREDVLGLALRLADQRAVLLEQAARLVAGAVRLLDRLADAVPAL